MNNINHEVIKNSKYIFDNKFYVPRVTEILSSMLHENSLMYWSNMLGFKKIKYMDELNRTANIGTISHSLINKFLTNNTIDKPCNNIPFLSFLNWYKSVSQNNKIKLLGSEQKIVCELFGGTYDALFSINNKIYLCDFKTSNYITYKHFLQLSAYKYMLEKQNTLLDGVFILQLNKNKISYKEYLLHFDDDNHRKFIDECTETFISLTESYYKRKEIEYNFDNIFRRS